MPVCDLLSLIHGDLRVASGYVPKARAASMSAVVDAIPASGHAPGPKSDLESKLELVESVIVAWRALDLAGKQPSLVRGPFLIALRCVQTRLQARTYTRLYMNKCAMWV